MNKQTITLRLEWPEFVVLLGFVLVLISTVGVAAVERLADGVAAVTPLAADASAPSTLSRPDAGTPIDAAEERRGSCDAGTLSEGALDGREGQADESPGSSVETRPFQAPARPHKADRDQ